MKHLSSKFAEAGLVHVTVPPSKNWCRRRMVVGIGTCEIQSMWRMKRSWTVLVSAGDRGVDCCLKGPQLLCLGDWNPNIMVWLLLLLFLNGFIFMLVSPKISSQGWKNRVMIRDGGEWPSVLRKACVSSWWSCSWLFIFHSLEHANLINEHNVS